MREQKHRKKLSMIKNKIHVYIKKHYTYLSLISILVDDLTSCKLNMRNVNRATFVGRGVVPELVLNFLMD